VEKLSDPSAPTHRGVPHDSSLNYTLLLRAFLTARSLLSSETVHSGSRVAALGHCGMAIECSQSASSCSPSDPRGIHSATNIIIASFTYRRARIAELVCVEVQLRYRHIDANGLGYRCGTLSCDVTVVEEHRRNLQLRATERLREGHATRRPQPNTVVRQVERRGTVPHLLEGVLKGGDRGRLILVLPIRLCRLDLLDLPTLARSVAARAWKSRTISLRRLPAEQAGSPPRDGRTLSNSSSSARISSTSSSPLFTAVTAIVAGESTAASAMAVKGEFRTVQTYRPL